MIISSEVPLKKEGWSNLLSKKGKVVLPYWCRNNAMGSRLDVVNEAPSEGGRKKDNEEDELNSSKVSVVSGQVAASSVYEIINRAVNKEKLSIAFPKTWLRRIQYVFLVPLTHSQYYTIPYPGKGTESYYPLTLFLAIFWIWFYSYLICWFTYSVTKAFNLHFSIIPMFIYPFGISFRDIKKYSDFRDAVKQFKEEIPDQEVSLAEAFQG